jgi:hypothetical protein
VATNPPITIGPFSNVPAPGSGVKSDWAQQITNYVLRTPWVALPFNGNWANFGSGFQVCQYRKEGDRVWLRGQAVAGSSPPTQIATLPAGFRPVATILTMVGESSGAHHQRLDISTSGAMVITTPTVGFVYSLDNLSFSVSAT